MVLVKKKNGKQRFCVDYRALNAITKEDAYPLPLIHKIFDALHGATYFSIMDATSGFWQIPVAKEDQEKTAFATREGTYEFLVKPFGLTNAPATF